MQKLRPCSKSTTRVVAPDVRADLVPSDYLAGAANEQLEHLERLRRKPDRVSAPAQLAGRRIQLESPESEDLPAAHGELMQNSSPVHGVGRGVRHHSFRSTPARCRTGSVKSKAGGSHVAADRRRRPGFRVGHDRGRIKFHEWLGDSWGCCSRTRRISRRCAPPSWAPWRGSSPSSTSAAPRSSAERRPRRGPPSLVDATSRRRRDTRRTTR